MPEGSTATQAPGLTMNKRIRAILGGSAGNLVDWYDWFAYSSFALYFASAFFPKGDQTAQLLQSAAIFAVGFLARHKSDDQLIEAAPAAPAMRADLDAAFEEACDRTAPIPGGGRLIIEPTAALVAIDVDAGDRSGSNDPETFARDLNLAAAGEALRQIRLRDLGGLIAIDFVSMRSAKAGEAVMAALKAHNDPWGLAFAPMSRFGIVELSRPQLRRPLREAMCGPDGRLSTEAEAFAVLRTIESAVRAEPGRRIVAALAPPVAAVLEAAPFDWRGGLDARLGRRWRIDGAPPAGRAFDVRSD
jgi:hypothetical protein